MVGTTIRQNVDLAVDGSDVQAVIQQIIGSMDLILSKVSKVGSSAQAGTARANAETRKWIAEFDKLQRRAEVLQNTLSSTKALGEVLRTKERELQLERSISSESRQQLENIRRGLKFSEQRLALERIAAREALTQRVNRPESVFTADLQRQSNRFRFSEQTVQATTIQQATVAYEKAGQRLIAIKRQIDATLARGDTVSAGRLNALTQVYDRQNSRLAEQLRLLQQVQAFQAKLPANRSKAINDALFGDGGAAFATRIGGAALIGTAIFSVINAIRDGARFVVEFDDSLKQLQAISGSTNTELNKLADGIINVASQTKFATTDIAKAAVTIAQAGFGGDELQSVLDSALKLATASGSTPQESVDVLTSSLGAFQLQATEADRVTNLLVGALNETKLTIPQVAAAIQFAGSTAKESGVQFEELVTIAGSLANAGVRSGSTIGTGLRQLLVDFQTPTKELKEQLKDVGLTLADIDVRGLGFAEVVRRLSEAGFGATQAYEGLEVRAASAFLAFKNQLPVYDELQRNLLLTNAAADAQAKALDSLSAQWQIFKNNLNAFLAGGVGDVTQGLKSLLSLINELITFLGDTSEVATSGFAKGLEDLLRNLGLQEGTIQILVHGYDEYVTAVDKATAKSNESVAAAKSQQLTFNDVDEAINHVIDRQGELANNHIALSNETLSLTQRFEGLQTEINNTDGSYQSLLTTLRQYQIEQARILKTKFEIQKVDAEATARALEADIPNIRSDNRLFRLFNKQQTLNNPTIREALAVTQGGTGDPIQINELINKLSGAQFKTVPLIQNLISDLNKVLSNATQTAKAESDARVASTNIQSVEPFLTPGFESILRTADNARLNANAAISGFREDPKTGRVALQKVFEDLTSQLEQATFLLDSFAKDDPARIPLQTEVSNIAAELNKVKRELKPSKEEVKAAEREAKATQRSLANTASLETVATKAEVTALIAQVKAGAAADVDQVERQIKELQDKQLKEAVDAFDKKNPTAGASPERVASINEGRAAVIRKLEADFDKQLTDFYKASGQNIVTSLKQLFSNIDEKTNRALLDIDRSLAGIEAEAQTRQRPDRAFRLGAGEKILFDRRVQAANDAADIQRLGILKPAIDEKQKALGDARDNLTNVNSPKERAKLIEEIDQRQTELNRATLEYEQIQARVNARSQDFVNAPLGERLRAVSEEWLKASGAANDFGQVIENNLGEILDGLSGQFTEFFTSILDGTQSALGAFKNLVAGFAKLVRDILIKAAALAAIDFIFSLFGVQVTPQGRIQRTGGSSSTGSAPGVAWNGGRIKGMIGGGRVTDGIDTRDSTLTKLAKDEFVVRNAAARSVGFDFLNKLNREGAGALKNSGIIIPNLPTAEQKVNVYVVQPDFKEQMGPNDIIVTLAEDILRGGTTKKLIQQVQNGGI